MGLFTRLWGRIRTWDKAAQWALWAALGVFVAALAWLLIGGEAARTPSGAMALGAILALQAVWLWGNRNLLTAYSLAQRQFIAGDFVAVRETLLAYQAACEQAGKRPSAESLVLLGNAYRNLGELKASEATLLEATRRQPDSHFALYALGKTRLAQGQYQEASTIISESLRRGAAPHVQFDVGHASYRAGDWAQARQLLAAQAWEGEHRQAMSAYLLWRMGVAPRPDAGVLAAGLPFWLAEVARSASSPYAAELAEDVEQMRQLCATNGKV